jgi:hypothetical protein
VYGYSEENNAIKQNLHDLQFASKKYKANAKKKTDVTRVMDNKILL